MARRKIALNVLEQQQTEYISCRSKYAPQRYYRHSYELMKHRKDYYNNPIEGSVENPIMNRLYQAYKHKKVFFITKKTFALQDGLEPTTP